MFLLFSQFELLLAGMCGVIAGALGCWLAQKYLRRQQRTSSRQVTLTTLANETPAIQAAAQAHANPWSEPEQLLCQIQDCLKLLERETLAPKTAQTTLEGQQALRQLQRWVAREKKAARSANPDDTAAALKQREAEDEMVLKWLQDHPASTPAPRQAAPELSHPELALSQIASELLPFNPIAVRLIGKTAEPDMTAAVERIEKLLASVDPPETLSTLPAGTLTTAAPTIRDPQGRANPQPEDQQRRRSDQAIIYNTLLRRCLGDDDFAWRMLHKFPTRCRAELESLATELRRRAWTAATRRINQLRGMAANIAAENLRDALANLEHVCRLQSATRADQLLEAVHGEFQQVLDFIARAGAEPALETPATEEAQAVSRWPAGLLSHEDQPLQLATTTLDHSPAVRVS